MIPPIPSDPVPPDITAQTLLQIGNPFLEFPKYSILKLHDDAGAGGPDVPFAEWLMRTLQIGQPVVIQDFDKLPAWDQPTFEIERLIELSTKKSESFPRLHLSIGVFSAALTKICRYSDPQLQHWSRSEFYPTQVCRLCPSILPRVSDSLRP